MLVKAFVVEVNGKEWMCVLDFRKEPMSVRAALRADQGKSGEPHEFNFPVNLTDGFSVANLGGRLYDELCEASGQKGPTPPVERHRFAQLCWDMVNDRLNQPTIAIRGLETGQESVSRESQQGSGA